MKGPPLGPCGEDITWPDQVAPRVRKASSTCKIKPQTSNLQASSAAGEARLSGGLGAESRVSTQRVRRGLHCRAHPCFARCRRVPTWRYRRLRAGGDCVPPWPGSGVTVRRGRFPPTCPDARKAGGGGCHQAHGAMACWGAHPGLFVCPPPLSLFAIRWAGLSLPGVRPDSRRVAASPPDRWRHGPWVLPSPAPPLVWGPGTAVVAGPSGGSASG